MTTSTLIPPHARSEGGTLWRLPFSALRSAPPSFLRRPGGAIRTSALLHIDRLHRGLGQQLPRRKRLDPAERILGSLSGRLLFGGHRYKAEFSQCSHG